MSRIGYVVIEWNQASHQPGLLPYSDMYDTRADAEDAAKEAEAGTAAVGRRERYTVAEVLDEGDD